MIYTNEHNGEKWHRVFSENTPDEELKWHMDEFTREIISINETDWKIQLDNELPKSINSKVIIPSKRWHRLIKGTNDLTIEIIEIK